eukprot:104816-Prymnesium_polylepis.1
MSPYPSAREIASDRLTFAHHSTPATTPAGTPTVWKRKTCSASSSSAFRGVPSCAIQKEDEASGQAASRQSRRRASSASRRAESRLS